MSERTSSDKTRCLSYLQKSGLIKVERDGRAAFVVTVVVDGFVAA
jgi:predicted transcriptional regulator